MKKILAPMMATALILSGAAAFAADPAPAPAAHPHVDRFKEADTNNDGFLTKEEMKAQQDKRLDEMFAKTDTNHDGKLSKDEMKAGREEMKKNWKERRENGGPVPGGPAPVAPPVAK